MISHRHKAVFVHIPKCGGMSVEHLFLADLGLKWEQRAPLLLRPRLEDEVAPARLAHLTAQEYVAGHYLSRELFDAYLKFAIVRDPHARAASSYRYLGLDKIMSFPRFIDDYLPRAVADTAHPWQWFLRPQADFVTAEDGDLIVDDLVRLERIDQDLPPVLAKAGIEVNRVPHVNPSEPRTMIRAAKARVKYAAQHRTMPALFGTRDVEWTDALWSRVDTVYAPDVELLKNVGETAD